MKDRLVTFGLSLGALALFYVLFVPKPAPAENAPALPVSTESRPNGYQGIWRWLKSGGVPVAALHERYDRLPADTAGPTSMGEVLKPTGNILLTTLPHKLPVRPAEAAQLDRWVERGNTLIVMAALDDLPLWALSGDMRLVEAVGRLTRLRFVPVGTPGQRPIGRALKSLVQPESLFIEARGGHPLLQGVQTVQVTSEFPAARWRATPMDRSGALQIGQIAGTGDAAIFLRRQGAGQVITFAAAGIFANGSIGTRDNARLLSNLIAWSRGAAGTVIFDDAHQGAVSYYDGKAFFADSRLHRTLAWIVLLWFVFVLAVQRLRTRITHWNPVDITAFVGSSGEFFAATLTPTAAAARLLANFFDSIRRRTGSARDAAAEWQWLSSQAGVAQHDVAELRGLHDRVRAGRPVDLVRLQNLLVQLQGNVL